MRNSYDIVKVLTSLVQSTITHTKIYNNCVCTEKDAGNIGCKM